MSSEDYDAIKALTSEHKQQKLDRRMRATRDFLEAAALARNCGLKLLRHSETHYTLTGFGEFNREWLINLYPGNLRLLADKSKSRATAPFLHVPLPWSLIDVVKSGANLPIE